MSWRTDPKKYHSDVDELSWQAGKSIPDFMTSRGKKRGNIYGFGNPCHVQIQKHFPSRQIFCLCEENFEKFSRSKLFPPSQLMLVDGDNMFHFLCEVIPFLSCTCSICFLDASVYLYNVHPKTREIRPGH